MAEIYIISCASSKQSFRAKAKDLYVSPLFTKSRQLAEKNSDRWFILSAKHGLLDPEDLIDPYDVSLNKFSKVERIDWAKRVLKQVLEQTQNDDVITLLAGHNYSDLISNDLAEQGLQIKKPLERLSIGKQLRLLNSLLENPEQLADLTRFYDLLSKLEIGVGGKRLMSESAAKSGWPSRGLYFFFENDEYRRINSRQLRVVRVGTHAVSTGSKSTLWGRLRNHRGTSDGFGNHRGSIFRLHVGNATLARHSQTHPTWGIGSFADKQTQLKENKIESLVSEYIGSMSVLWIAVADEPGPSSDRAYLEANIIGLLSSVLGSSDRVNPNWLGNFSPQPLIRDSGLWNLNYVGDGYDPPFLEILNEYVEATIGLKSLPEQSIAPAREKINKSKKQAKLF